MTFKQLGRLLTAVILAATPALATVSVSAHLTDPSGSPASVAYVRFELTNCGFNVPAVPAQPSSVVWKHIDLKPNKTTGLATGTIYGNDEILCGGSQSSLWHVTAFSDANTAIAGDQDYLIEASLGAWEFSAANPFTGNRPPPGFQVVFANPTSNQRIVQPSGTSLAITGTFDLTNAVVIGFTGTPGSPGLGISVNGSNVNATALNFGQTPAAPSGALNVTWQRDALNPANASAYVMGSSSSAMGVIQLGGDFCSSSTATVPTVCSLHLPAALSVAQGGTGQASAAAAFNALAPSTVSGGLIVGTGVNTYGNLAPPAGTKVLTSTAGVVGWNTPAAGSINAGTTNLLPKYCDGPNSIICSSSVQDTGTNVVIATEPALIKTLNGALHASDFSGSDASAKIQAAITACPAAGCTIDARDLSDVGGTGSTIIDAGTKQVTLYIGPYTYNFQQVVLEQGFQLIGVGAFRSWIKATDGTKPLFVIPQATGTPAFHVYLKGFEAFGATSNTSQDGLFADASNPATSGNGLEYSRVEQVHFQGFKGNAIHLKGHNGNYASVNQFITFENCTIFRVAGGAEGIRIEGANGQDDFNNVLVDGQSKGDGTSIYVGILAGNTFAYPYSINFRTLTAQSADVAVQLNGCYQCSFRDSHHEALNGGYLLNTGQANTGILIDHVYFAPDGSYINGGNGYLYNAVATTNTLLFTNNIYGSPDNVGLGAGANTNVLSIGNTGGFGTSSSLPGAVLPGQTFIPPTGILTVQGILDASAAVSLKIPRTSQANPNSPQIACATGDILFDTASTAGQNIWNCSATNTWTQNLNSGVGGATVTLNNLTTTAINADLLPSGTRHLGATTTPWADIFLGGASGNTAQLTGTFTANRVVTIPDATFTVAGLSLTNTFTANNTFNANVQLGASGRVISGATGAPTSSCVLCFGSADRARYGTNSFNLIGVTSASGPVQLGDTPGVSLLGPITSVTNGQNLSIQPLVAPTNTVGGTTTVSGGAGNGTGANGDLILAAGSGGSAGTGFIQLNSGGTIPCVNAASGTTLNGLASYSATGCVTTPHGSTLGLAGVCVEGCGATGTAKIARIGSAPLTLDNTGTQGDYACISSGSDGQATDCGLSPTTQTVGVIKSLQSGALYVVDVNVAGVSSGGAAGSVVLSPGANQTIQGTAPTVPALTMKAPASAGSTQVIAQMLDNTGANAFNCQQNDTCQVGAGVGGTVQLSHVLGPNANASTTGFIQASSGDIIIGARNFANNADLTLTKNSSDEFSFTAPVKALWFKSTTGPFIQTEIADPGATASADVSWGDSTTHWPSFNANSVGTRRYDAIPQVNTQSGTTYTVVVADATKLVNFTNGGAIAVTLPQSTGVFGTNFCFYSNAGGAGTVTITPTTSTINGAASLALSSGQNAMTCADGSGNYIATISSAGGGSGDMIKNAANVMGASGTLNGAAMSVTAGLTFPKGAGANPTSDGVFAQDTTLHLPVFGNGTSTRVFGGLPVNAQSGTTYTILTTDANKLLKFGNVGAVAVTLPQAGASFPNGWMAHVSNTAAGLVTITPTTSTIDGGATVTLSNGQSYCIFSDGTNYFSGCKGAQSGLGDPGGTGIVVETATNVTINRTLTGTANQLTVTNGSGVSGNPTIALDTTHVVTDTNSITLTNKTQDAEGTGNVFTRPFYTEFTPGCNNATSGPGSFDVPTSAAATFSCFGTTTTQGVADFVDASTTTATGHFTLPQGWTGNMDVRILWFANASSANAVRFSVQTGCTGDGDATSTGPSYNAASASNTAYTGTANQQKTTTLSAVAMTNCVAGEEMYFQVQRIGGDAGDTLTSTAEVKAVQFEGRATK